MHLSDFIDFKSLPQLALSLLSCPATLLSSLHFSSPPFPSPPILFSLLPAFLFPFSPPLIIPNAWPKMLLIFVNFYFLPTFFCLCMCMGMLAHMHACADGGCVYIRKYRYLCRPNAGFENPVAGITAQSGSLELN